MLQLLKPQLKTLNSKNCVIIAEDPTKLSISKEEVIWPNLDR